MNIPFQEMPFYKEIRASDLWYGLLPELMNIQGAWLDQEKKKIKLPKEVNSYFQSAFSIWHTALIVAGNGRGYFALHSLRAILERAALVWTAHSSSAYRPSDLISDLGSNNRKVRTNATERFVEVAEANDPDFSRMYRIVGRYFAHVSSMDQISIGHVSDKDKLLQTRSQMLPLLLLLDAGHRMVRLIQALADQQGISLAKLHGGRVGVFEYSIDRYVRVCAYIMCEGHSRNRSIPINTTLSNVSDLDGKFIMKSIWRGGMEILRNGDPDNRPTEADLAQLAWYAIGRGHDDKITVKRDKKWQGQGDRYTLSWPKTLDLDSYCSCAIAYMPYSLEFFDYVTRFFSVCQGKHGSPIPLVAKPF